MLIASFLVVLLSPIRIAAETTNEILPLVRLPAGWRLPREAEVDQAWRSSDANKYLVVKGNFDGGGGTGVALLLVRGTGSGFAPFVALKQEAGEPKVFQVEAINAKEYLAAEGLKLARSGTYITACGKGYGCASGEQKSITLSFDGVEFFKEEGASRLIYFDPKAQSFKEAWLSD